MYPLNYFLAVVYYDYALPHWRLLCTALVLLVLWKVIKFALVVWCKRRWIKAALQQTADDMTRIENLDIQDDVEWMRGLMSEFLVSGLAQVRANTGGVLLQETRDTENLLKAATAVSDAATSMTDVYVARRRLLRHVLDGLEALIGEHHSSERAWSKGLLYIDSYRAHHGADVDLPWIQPFLKVMQLPWNTHSHAFDEAVGWANARRAPPGWFSLWVACWAFDYVSALRYGALVRFGDGTTRWVEHRGARAWSMMLTYKAWHHKRVEILEHANDSAEGV